MTIEIINSVLKKFELDMNFEDLVRMYEKDGGYSNGTDYYLTGKGRNYLIDFLIGFVLYEKQRILVFDWKEEVQLPNDKGHKYVEYDSQADSRSFYIVKEDVIFTPEEKELLRIL